VGGYSEVGGEPQVVGLAVEQAAGQRVVLFIGLPVRALAWLAPISAAERYRVTCSARAAGSTAWRPWLMAAVARRCIPVMASAAWVAQHHWPAGAASVTACSSRRACAQQS
jgi:hypothetical protein